LRLGNLRLLRSLEGVENLLKLQRLEIQTCRAIRSLKSLSYLEGLEVLNISNDGELDSLTPLKELPNLHTVLFYESTNIVDGDLSPIFLNRNVSLVAFQNRRHYSHKREDFATRVQEWSMPNTDQLAIPQAAGTDAAAFELLRVWVANNQQHVSLRTSVWEDPAAWGIMLADLARHVAESYRQEEGRDVATTLERIKAGIDAELG
jgi:Domain of unknown function (DUF5076)